MKCLLQGTIGALLVLVLAALAYSQYSDYRSKAETDAWLAQLQPTLKEIGDRLVAQKSAQGIGVKVAKPSFSPPNVQFLEVSESGVVQIGGGTEGQLMVLTPTLEADKIVWRCRGGPAKAISLRCKS